jgi:dTDP-4-dehydrorhamnose reductase
VKILLFGKDGQVGWELQRALAQLGELVALGRESGDFDRPSTLRGIVQKIAPDVIVNAAAYTAVDKAQSEPDRAQRINAEAVGILAEEASRRDAWVVHYSTDYVFDGTKPTPYLENDATRPLSVYGSTKREGEQVLRERNKRHLIFRTSWVYGMHGSNFAKTMLRLAKERDELNVVGDQYGAPTSAELLADVTALALYRVSMHASAAGSLAGTYHAAADGETTWCDYARYVVGLALEKGASFKAAPDRIRSIPTEAYPVAAARPKNSRLDCGKLRTTFDLHPPHWRYHVARLVEELTSSGAL